MIRTAKEENMKKKVYEKLEAERIKYGYTYFQMAEMLGISKSYYWQIEHRNRNLYYDMAVKIAKIFNKKPDDLFFE